MAYQLHPAPESAARMDSCETLQNKVFHKIWRGFDGHLADSLAASDKSKVTKKCLSGFPSKRLKSDPQSDVSDQKSLLSEKSSCP